MDHHFPASFSQTFQVRYHECGADRSVRAAAHLQLFQEIAFSLSAACGFPLAWYEARRLFWVTRRVHLVVHLRAQYGERLTYTTRLVGARRVLARRINTATRTSDNALVATCLTDWVFTRDGTAAVRIDQGLVAAFPAMSRPVAPIALDDPTPPPTMAYAPVHIRASDLDGVGHVNHPVYVDLLDDAVIRGGGGRSVAAHPRTYAVQYHAATQPGDPLRDAAWEDGGGWRYRLERADGSLVLHGQLSPEETVLDG
ncbi:MAG: acyl-[acyl-carrier-protein] thioesterase [Armatimonadota bacterium]|nr:acyl-[acyl-carrier-protein] thioesterase [Armatimonadota bacterium]